MGLFIKFSGSFLVLAILLFVIYRMLAEQGFLQPDLARSRKGKAFFQSAGLAICTQLAVFFTGATVHQAVHGKTNFFQLEQIWLKGYAEKIADVAAKGSAASDVLSSGSLPFYPLLLGAVNGLTKGGYLLSGIIISSLALIISCYYLYELVVLDFEERIAWNSVKFFLLFPFVFLLYLSTPDSLFLVSSIGAFYYLRKQKWALAGVMSLLAVLFDLRGVLLILPILYELLAGRIKDRKGILPVAGVLLGLFTVLMYSSSKYGTVFAFLKPNPNNFNFIYPLVPQGYPAVSGTILPFIALLSASLVGVFLGLGRIRISYLLYALPLLIVSVFVPWIGIQPGQFAFAFPLFIVQGLSAKSRTLNIILTFLNIIFMGLCLYSYISVQG